MNYFDPARGDPPRLQWEGKLIQGVVPALQVTPEPPGENWEVCIGVCLIVAPNTARWLFSKFPGEALGELVQEYEHDPEWFLTHYFNWGYAPEAGKAVQRPGKEKLTLSDLGL